MQYINNGSFICDRCRNICKAGCHEKLTKLLEGDLSEYEGNKDLLGRKQIIHCLGKYCENPCQYQREEYTPYNEEDGLKPLFGIIHWMGQKLTDVLTNKKKEDDGRKEKDSKGGN